MLSYTSVVVYLVYLSIQTNLAKYFNYFAICMATLDYIRKSTQSVKCNFQGSWESGELFQ